MVSIVKKLLRAVCVRVCVEHGIDVLLSVILYSRRRVCVVCVVLV